MKALFIGAHTDDIELGAGGVFNKMLHSNNHQVYYYSLSRCVDLQRNKGIELDQSRIKEYILHHNGHVFMSDFPNRFLDSYSAEIRASLEEKRDTIQPDIVFTHWEKDIHQDHLTVYKESIRVFRNYTLLQYECPRSCHNFISNIFIPLRENDLIKKIQMLKMYKTQKDLYYLSDGFIKSSAIVSGNTFEENYAERFFSNRFILNI